MSEFSWTTLADTCRRFVRAHDDPHVDDQILGTILRNLRDAAGAPAEITDCLRELFTVPLSAMFHTYEMGDAVVWSCKLGGPWIGEDPSCRTDTTANSESAAQSAAVAHLESVHGIRRMSLLDNLTPEHAIHIRGLIANRNQLQDRVDVLSTMLRRMARRSVEHRQDAASWEFDYWDLLDEIGGVSPE